MLVIIELRSRLAPIFFLLHSGRNNTYKTPTRNIPSTIVLVRVLICNEKTPHIGMARIAVSKTISKLLMLAKKAPKLRHRPGLVRCQKWSTGMQITNPVIKAATNQTEETPTRIAEAMRYGRVEKMCRYITRMESLQA
jgi:hypothetical protein